MSNLESSIILSICVNCRSNLLFMYVCAMTLLFIPVRSFFQTSSNM